jgi:dihydrofolate reductase
MINAIFAADHYGGIGFQGTLPWPHNSNDLKHFKKLTEGHIVVMGRRTYDDPKMPKPLPNRTVYVVSNRLIADSVFQLSGNIADRVLELEQQNPNKIIWVIGGADIIQQCEGIYDKIYLTHFKGAYKIDTRINLKSLLSGCSMRTASAAPEDNCTFVVYETVFKRTKTSTQ